MWVTITQAKLFDSVPKLNKWLATDRPQLVDVKITATQFDIRYLAIYNVQVEVEENVE